MSEKLLSVSRLHVVACTTHELRLNNRKASLANLRNGKEVSEAIKIGLQHRDKAMFGEGYLHCIGSLVVGSDNVLMTHHNAEDLSYLRKTDSEITRVDTEVLKLSGDVAVVWSKKFSDVAEADLHYKNTAISLKDKLIKLYLEHVSSVYELVFDGSFWPVSAYYQADTLQFLANLEDYKKLLKPDIKRLK